MVTGPSEMIESHIPYGGLEVLKGPDNLSCLAAQVHGNGQA